MITLIYGGSGSGKSEYAEKIVVEAYEREKKEKTFEGKLFYIATMQINDDESKKRVERHRQLRAGKGFITIEQEKNIDKAIKKGIQKKDIVLLECLSNLIANEIFSKDVEFPEDAYAFADILWQSIRILEMNCKHLVIVSNDIFSDGSQYDFYTHTYIKILGILQQYIAKEATDVIEVVYGIPVYVKGQRNE